MSLPRSAAARDERAQKRLWEVTRAMTEPASRSWN